MESERKRTRRRREAALAEGRRVDGDVQSGPQLVDLPEATKESFKETVSRSAADLSVKVGSVAEALQGQITLGKTRVPETAARPLWVAIRNRTEAIGFNRYAEFIDRVLCDRQDRTGVIDYVNRRGSFYAPGVHGVDAYHLLRIATEVFLLQECGVSVEFPRDPVYGTRPDDNDVLEVKPSIATQTKAVTAASNGNPLDTPVPEEEVRVGPPAITYREVRDQLEKYLGASGGRLPYLNRILDTLQDEAHVTSPYCFGILKNRLSPCLIELIWCYYQEEGGLCQAPQVIARRFQNIRRDAGRDPLARLELDPLRPLNNLLWGYIQDEHNRLGVRRRAYEYDHHYGLTLYGKAVGPIQPADSRSKFLEAFHNLLHLCSIFYKEDADTTVIADGFPLLNALREVHLILAEGAHNQFGDLPWTARVEMLIQQWLLARPEIREFLGGRIMVPYHEPWMGQVDTMKTLQGWTDVSVTHFRNLAVYGERILLSIRYDDWINESYGQNDAKFWARYWEPEIQGYIHAYRAATGVDLAARPDSILPSIHLRNRLATRAARHV